MGRKKKKQLKPWCWYCNREFDDEKILIQHQKSKHFKCSFCHKKLYTGPGLSIHSMQVHKEKIDKIPFALPHRSNVDIEIYGMEGIPDEDLKEHEKQKVGKDDEPEEKKPKVENPVTTTYTVPSLPINPGMPYIPPLSLSIVSHGLPLGLGPPLLVARPTLQVPRVIPTSINPITNPVPVVSTFLPVSQHSIPNNNFNNYYDDKFADIPPPPPPPPPTEDIAQKSTEPTFPAYSGAVDEEKIIHKVAKPTSSTPNVKVILIHPDDDIPLEQIRLRSKKYVQYAKSIEKNTTTKIINNKEKCIVTEIPVRPMFTHPRNNYPISSWNPIRPPF